MVQYVVFLDTPKYWYLPFLDTPKSALIFMIFYELLWLYIYISVKSAHGYFMVACCIPIINIHQWHPINSSQAGFHRVNRSQGGHRLDAVRISAALACQPAPSHDDTLEAGFTMQTRKIISKKKCKKLICSSCSLLSNLRICSILPKDAVKTK
jgi:hypothetical protein